MRPFTSKGIAYVSVGYRAGNVGRYPAQIEDIRLAIQWLRANATQYNLDMSRVCFSGTSAGDFAAAWLGVLESAQYVITDAAPVDLTVPQGDGEDDVVAMLNGHDRRAASPIFHLIADFPPTMVVHGRGDKTIPVAQGRAFRDKLLSLSVAVLYVEHWAEHWSGGLYSEKAAFAVRHLQD